MKVSVFLIQGLVQGVGFRPFIYRIASEMGIGGEVDNRNNGVGIRAVLSCTQKKRFLERIKNELPPVAFIHRISELEPEYTDRPYTGFTIVPSCPGSDEVTQVSPDIAVCPDCLHDRLAQTHRIGYPFINCTHCGPRFTIIRALPYDRAQTTMESFAMCRGCLQEYTSVTDRRFHAQPIACNHCGPVYYAVYQHTKYTDYSTLLALTTRLLEAGEVIAVKGTGGYHLVCDAQNEQAVLRLRRIKLRDTKPFAVMFRDMETAKAYTYINPVEEEILSSWRRPIVLLEQNNRLLAPSLNPGMHTLGAMLPYMPVHYDWFDRLAVPALVMTSGNLSEQPVAIDPEEAEEQLHDKVALILHHNRAIYNRADDSVVQVCHSQPCVLRRSRGYVPEPFFADISVEGILAFGAEKVNAFALGKGETILQSQYIGDLKNWETFRFYQQSLERFQQLFRFTPRRLVCDLHPDYFSSREAERMATEQGLSLLKVQHHHAHAAACMLEYGLHEPVIALVMDGTGLGDDGTVWGGEFFLCDRKSYRRMAHLEYFPLPGGDKASAEPWRMAVACLWKSGLPLPASFEKRIGKEKTELVIKMMEKKINTPFTCSAGRLFDAVASLTGICDFATRQAEAPVLLEQAALKGDWRPYPFEAGTGEEVTLRPLIRQLWQEVTAGTAAAIISARFHRTLAGILQEKAMALLQQTGTEKVILSGGCFQNKLLTECLQRQFAESGIPLYVPGRIPCNDGGIAAGQLAIAGEKGFAP